MKNIILFLTITCATIASAEVNTLVTITEKNVLLYENPQTSSPIVRRVFLGEVLKVTESIKTPQGESWGKVFLSPNHIAYIQGQYLANSGSIHQQIWQPEEVTRSRLPFSFAAKGTSELFGPGIQFRYLPFTRLGLTIGAGSILDSGKARGFSVAYGVTCLLAMKNFSPFVETGTSTLTLNDDHSSLRISSFYINAGAEWILHSGYYIGAGLSYNRSYNVQVAYDYSYLKSKNGTVALGNYGSFTGLNSAESLERLNPLFIVGYSF